MQTVNPCQVHIILLIACHIRSVLFSCDICQNKLPRSHVAEVHMLNRLLILNLKFFPMTKLRQDHSDHSLWSLLMNDLFWGLNSFCQICAFKNELQARGVLPRSRRTCSLVLFFFTPMSPPLLLT